jgi:hypothetical protein
MRINYIFPNTIKYKHFIFLRLLARHNNNNKKHVIYDVLSFFSIFFHQDRKNKSAYKHNYYARQKTKINNYVRHATEEKITLCENVLEIAYMPAELQGFASLSSKKNHILNFLLEAALNMFLCNLLIFV